MPPPPPVFTLQTVDDGIIADQDLDNVGRPPVPDEKLAVVRAGHHELGVAAKEVCLLDVGGGVAGAHVPACEIPRLPPPYPLLMVATRIYIFLKLF